MSSAEEAEEMATDSRHWLFPIARALPAALMAIAITFTADHSTRLGLVVFGGFAVLSGIVMLWPGIRLAAAAQEVAGASRKLVWPAQGASGLIHGGLTVVAGAAALVAGVVMGGAAGSLQLLVTIVAAWGLAAGGLELYAGVRARERHDAARDASFIGVLTILLAVVMLVVPPGYAEAYSVPDGASGVVTASIVMVGALGAYGAIAAVYLVIAGLSLKPAPAAKRDEAAVPDQATPDQATQDGTP